MINVAIIEKQRQCHKDSDLAMMGLKRAITWHDLKHNVLCICSFLENNQIGRVLVLSDNNEEAVFVQSAAASLRSPCLFLDPTLGIAEQVRCIQAFNPDVIVYSDKHWELAQTLNRHVSRKLIHLRTIGALAPPSRLEDVLDIAERKHLELYSLTSGTFGMPKLVFRDTSFDQRRFDYFIGQLGFDGTERFIAAIPFHHASVMGWGRMFLSIGGSLILSDLEVKSLASAILTGKADCIVCSPQLITGIANYLNSSGKRVKPAMKFILVGGKNFSPVQKKAVTDYFGDVVYEYYGTTETGVNTLAWPDHIKQFPFSSGMVLPGNRMIFLDPNMQLCRPDSGGRIAIQSYQTMKEYRNVCEDPFVQIDSDRYFVTPDYGFMKDDLVYVTNRLASVGCTVDIYSIENAVRNIQGVKDAFATIGANNALDILIASSRGESEIVWRCRNVLEQISQQSTVRIRVTQEIPYSPLGKVRVNEINYFLQGVSQ
jgi:acyl-CoA synthetase (AMP-forming)/AMP-acid ligase II